MKVVLLHSALGDSRLWHNQIGVLGGAHQVLAPDLPGFGTEPLPTGSVSFVDRVTPHLPAALVGNSFGGGVALRTALAYPDQVTRLALIGSGLPDWEWSDELREHFAREEEAYEAGDFDAATELNMEFWVAPEFRDEVRPQQQLANELQTVDEDPEVVWPELAPLSSLTMPVLVVVGDQDKSDFIAIARHLAAEIPGAELAVVAGAGHLVGLERPEELNALLLDFLVSDT
jgi:3-oxoadipate enol-lactonase